MTFLIQVSDRQIGADVVLSVSARDLHEGLEVRKDFSDWIKYQLERMNFKENKDFRLSPKIGEKSFGRPSIDYALTLDAAKHIAMATGTDRGHEVREYFLECERRALRGAQALAKMPTHSEALRGWAAELERADALSVVVNEQAGQIRELKPKAEIMDNFVEGDEIYSMTCAAKELGKNPRWLMGYLSSEEMKWIYRGTGGRWAATQAQVDAGRMLHRHYSTKDNAGKETLRSTAYVTAKGLARLMFLLRVQAPAQTSLALANWTQLQ